MTAATCDSRNTFGLLCSAAYREVMAEGIKGPNNNIAVRFLLGTIRAEARKLYRNGGFGFNRS